MSQSSKNQTESYIGNQLERVNDVIDSAERLYNETMADLGSVIGSLGDLEVPLPDDIKKEFSNQKFSGVVPVWAGTVDIAYDSPQLASYVEVPKITGVSLPDAPNDILPVTDIPFIEDRYYSALVLQFKTYLANGLVSGSGIPDAYEDAMYARDEARRNRETARLQTEISVEFSKRGFNRPPGAFASALAQASSDRAFILSDASRDVMVRRTELEQQFVQTINQAIPQIESLLIDHHNKEEERRMLVAKAGVDGAIEVWTNTWQRYRDLLEASKIEKELAIAQVNAAIETNKGIGLVNSQKLEEKKAALDAQIASVTSQTNVYSTLVSAFESSVNAYKSEQDVRIRVYESELKTETANAELRIKAAEASVQALISTQSILVEAAKANASVSAQVLASALNSINTALSYGHSSSYSWSDSYDASKQLNSGEETINYHYFNMTQAE